MSGRYLRIPIVVAVLIVLVLNGVRWHRQSSWQAGLLERVAPVATPKPGSLVLHDIRVPFDWYVWQGYVQDEEIELGAKLNCGPAVVAMALRYASRNGLQVSPQVVRQALLGAEDNHSGTTSADLARALEHWGVPWRYLDSMEDIGRAIGEDRIVLLPILIEAVTREEKQSTPALTAQGDVISGRYYAYGGGHWIVVKGMTYDEATRQTFVVAYDPNVWEGNPAYYYLDQQRYPKGVDRLYEYSEVVRGYRALAPNQAIEVLATPAAPAALNASAIQAVKGISHLPAKERSEPFWCSAQDGALHGLFRCAEPKR